MRIIEPSFEIISPTEINGNDILKEIEKIARTCYKSEDKITDLSAQDLIRQLLKRGHEAMLEFGPSITVKFICNRGFTHELVRHRIASYAQESTRYCNYSKEKHGNEITVIKPSVPMSLNNYNFWVESMKACEQAYMHLIKHGVPPQIARGVLPIDVKTEINIKANLREWRHIFKLRTSVAAHPSMHQLMRPLLKQLQTNIPIIFDDITYK